MRTILLLLGALLLAACSGSDPKTLTSEGYDALNRGDAKGALAKFEQALPGLDAKQDAYLRAAVGRCQALARIDTKKASAEFLALAKADKRVTPQDFHLIVGEMVTQRAFLDAIAVMHEGVKLHPGPKMNEIKDLVVAESTKAGDEGAMKELKGLGYIN
jgi:hypothetical protein